MVFFDKKAFADFSFFFYCLIYDFFLFGLSRLDWERKNLRQQEVEIYKNYRNYFLIENIWYFIKNYNTIISDLNILILSFILGNRNVNELYKNKLFRSYFRVLSNKKGFYSHFNNLFIKINFFDILKNNFLAGFKFIWKNIRFWFVIIIVLLITYFTLVVRSLPFNKIFFSWIGIFMFSYWLISGFVFFIKKYQFGKYTSVIQRFWRRSYILFWLIEGATFSVFLYLTINASQESFYMFDQISFYKTHLFSWKVFLLKLFPLVVLIILSYFLLLSLKWNILNKNIFILVLMTIILTYTVWLEFYQFFHVLNFYGNLNWIYDIDEHMWFLEQEPRRTRIVNHYIMLLFILKFWHIVFIYGFWVFFLLRTFEIGRIRYPMVAANLNNFIILYIFAWVFMYPWFKFFFKNYLYSPYTWFYINNRRLFLRVFFNDLKLIYYSFFNIFNNWSFYFYKTFKFDFFYWHFVNATNNYDAYRNNVIKNRVLKVLNNA